jgi:acyl-CoA hydrolase
MNTPVKYVSAEEALSVIQPGQRVFSHGSAHTPTYLLKHLAMQADRLRNVEVVSISVYGDVFIDKPELKDCFHLNSLFVSASIRKAVNEVCRLCACIFKRDTRTVQAKYFTN